MMENTFKTLFSLEIHMSDLVMHGIVVPRLSLGQGGGGNSAMSYCISQRKEKYKPMSKNDL